MGSMIADILGLFTFRSLYLRCLAYAIQRRARKERCPNCQHSLDSTPRVYSSSDCTTERLLRNPSIVAEFLCSACGGVTQFLYADDGTLSLIRNNAASETEPAN